MRWFKSREEKERERALKRQHEFSELFGRCIGGVVGNEVLSEFWSRLASILQEAYRLQSVFAPDSRSLAAALLLHEAQLLKRHGTNSREFHITVQGREVAKRVFHLQ